MNQYESQWNDNNSINESPQRYAHSMHRLLFIQPTNLITCYYQYELQWIKWIAYWINNQTQCVNLCFVYFSFRLLHNTKTCDTCDVLLFVRWSTTTQKLHKRKMVSYSSKSCSKRLQLVSAWSTQFRRRCRFQNCGKAPKSLSGAYSFVLTPQL